MLYRNNNDRGETRDQDNNLEFNQGREETRDLYLDKNPGRGMDRVLDLEENPCQDSLPAHQCQDNLRRAHRNHPILMMRVA